MTNRHEKDVFNFLYNGEPTNIKMKKDDFFELIREKLALNKERLFPECADGERCKEIKDLKELPPNGHLYKQIAEYSKDMEIISDRINNKNVRDATRILTNEERTAMRELYAKIEKKLGQVRRDLGIVEKYQNESGLFGTEDSYSYIVYFGIGKNKGRIFSTAPTASIARKEAREQIGKKTKITKILKI